MSNIYNRGNTFIKYLNVLFLSGSVPTFPDDYTTPTFSILFKNGAFSVVIADTPMTQGLDNTWFFSYTIPTNAQFGTYLIKYKVSINGVDTETTEDYIVGLPSAILTQGSGSCTVTDVVLDDFDSPIDLADVFVFSDEDSSFVLAHDVTDPSGNFTVFLNPGNYFVIFNKPGFISKELILVVDNSCSHTLTEKVCPDSPGIGAFSITDTVEDDSLTDLLNVDVFVYTTLDNVNPIAHATTDAMGEFTVLLDEGDYNVLFKKEGYVSETHALNVDSMGGHTFIGD